MKKFSLLLIGILIGLLIVLYRSDIPLDELKTKYAPPPSQFKHVWGVDVHYRDEGNHNDSLPIVLVHGTSSSLHTWDSIVPLLAKNRRVIRMDLPAFGLTGAHPDNDYSIAFYNEFIDSLMMRLGVNRYIIAGNSLGGSIAWNQSLYTPEKVKGIILINSGGYPKINEKGNIGFKLAATPIVGDVLSKFTPKILVRKSIEDVYSDDSRITDALIDRYFELLLREGNRKATIEIFKQRRFGQSEKIKNINTPALIIWGKDDQLIDVSNAFRFESDIKGSQLVIIPHSGHVPMEENPREVLDAIMAFLK